jgi:hypothetical protein
VAHLQRAGFLIVALLTIGIGGAAGTPGQRATNITLTAKQARGAAVLTRFIDASNSGNIRLAVAQFANGADSRRVVGANDCNYRTGRVVNYYGRTGVAAWLRRRHADHDHWTLTSMTLVGGTGAGLVYTRASDSLRERGFSTGVIWNAKVGFASSAASTRLTRFANAGNEEECRSPERP